MLHIDKNMPNTEKYQLHDDVLLTSVDDEMVLLDTRNGQYYGLNPVGCEILTLIKQGKTIEETENEICHRYSIAQKTARDDIAELVADLQEQNLLSKQ